ncbi:MAG TPA: T9SS type A sorting domain-containing protein [Flavobacteriales bacterium]|nr:T9SS type A sorting domain-containing protein [Flavobacteriales bacterium]
MSNTIDGVKNYVNICVVQNVSGTVDSDTCDIAYWGGMDEINRALTLTAYPNPANSSSFTLEADQGFGKLCYVNIHDEYGRVVYTSTCKPTGNSIRIDDFNVPDGVYFISLIYDQAYFKKIKLVVQHE